MTKNQLIKLRNIISDTISELEISDNYLKEATQPIEPSVAIGRLTRMEALGEKSVNEAMHANVKQRLTRLKYAIERMDNGTYGVCPLCKKDIPMGRLEAVPESVICVSCAEKKK